VPPPSNCLITNQLEHKHEDEKEETRIIDNPLFFYEFVVVSYAFGFWVFFGILIINKNWRHATGKLVFSDHIFSDDPYMVAIAHQSATTRNCRR
jgi:hypothetical protein